MKPVEQNWINAFTRGGQFLNNFVVMARQNIIRIFLVCVFVGSITGIYHWSKTAAEQDRYTLVAEALFRSTLLVNKDADRPVDLQHGDGTFTRATLQTRMNNPTYASDVESMERRFMAAFYRGLFWGLLAALIVTLIAQRIGRSLADDKHVRGAKLEDPKKVAKAIIKYNDEEREIQQNYEYAPYEIAGIPYPFRAETQHSLFVGSTGSGKTQGIARIVIQIKEREDLAVVYDKMRSFIERFYDPSRDILMNALDPRCPPWDIFKDARHLVDWENIAESIIPNENNQFTYFEQTARSVFAHTANRIAKSAKAEGFQPKISHIINALVALSDEELNAFLQGSPAALHIDPQNQRTTGSIRSTLGNAIRSLGYLRDPKPEETAFSIREWIRNADKGSIVFLTSRDDMHPVLQPLISMWVNLFTSALMSEPRSSKRSLWFLLDELPSLNRLPNLEAALAEARQYGACFLLGIQLVSQLRAIYGRDGADTIMGLTRSKVVFNPGDPITAEAMSQFIGKQEIHRKDHSMSIGATELRDGQSVQNRLTTEYIIMPEELAELRALNAILSYTGHFPACRIKLEYMSLEGDQPGFIEDPEAIERAENIYSNMSGLASFVPKTEINSETTQANASDDSSHETDSSEPEDVFVSTIDDEEDECEFDTPEDTKPTSDDQHSTPKLTSDDGLLAVDLDYEHPSEELLRKATDIHGISPLTTMDGKNHSSDDRNTALTDEKRSEEEDKRQREKLFGNIRQAAIEIDPDNLPEHFLER